MALPQLTAPKYETLLPSSGKAVQYRPYLVKEEKILLVALESKDQKQIVNATKDVVSACTFGKLDVNKLPIYDLEHLFLKLRCKSVGETAEVMLKCKCDDCEGFTPVKINLEEISVVFPEESKSKTINLTDSIGVTLKHFDFEAVQKLDSMREGDVGNTMNEMIISVIDSVFDDNGVYPAKDHSREELVAFVESLSRQQFEKIQAFINAIPTLKKTVKFKCKKCEKDNEVELSGLSDFFG